MRYLLILLFNIVLFAHSYNFDENKFVFAIGNTFHKVGNISFTKDKATITYSSPRYKQIIKNENNISIEGKSGKKYHLKGEALSHTKQFIDIMIKLGQFNEIKNNRDFDVKKENDKYILSFKNELRQMFLKAEVKVKNSKVTSFKLFMKNNDTLEIVKR
ncbi:MAG: hypothetical protein P794_09305 [Epsilonproteobacteria bacterium (ex Lamellibrachia satsuma)]|nr:MAG: hypothetical protein P794_09305 [Epsilonproteobacteria bacterium (ex Lamellibrachia satsuma)]